MVLRFTLHSALFILLTVLTQVGGLVWLISLIFRRRLLAFLALYLVSLFLVPQVAPFFGRVSLSCLEEGALEVATPLYCGLHRNYVTPELKQVLYEIADETAVAFPGTTTVVLDANFPFIDGFPLLPHLSHDDGRKVDLAYFYADQDGQFLNAATKSPIGYFAFEQGHTHCTKRWPTLRWDMSLIQQFFPTWKLEEQTNAKIIQLLTAHPKITKIFVEPHILEQLNISHEKLRFQGCRAARHDDHIHIQI